MIRHAFECARQRRGILTGATKSNASRYGYVLWDEVAAGPVAAIARVADEPTAIAVADDSEFGLGCSLSMADLERAEALAAEIDAGMVIVNAMTASDPRIPFGASSAAGSAESSAGSSECGFLHTQAVALNSMPTQ